jgi:hypothetical protein
MADLNEMHAADLMVIPLAGVKTQMGYVEPMSRPFQFGRGTPRLSRPCQFPTNLRKSEVFLRWVAYL